jgi:hypothetical protein
MATRSTYAADVDLVLFLKAPHNAKRRLAVQIGDLATAAATLLWNCTLQDIEDWHGSIWFSPANSQDEAWLISQLGRKKSIISQKGSTLGERINYVDHELRSQGLTKIIFIGTDCPGLDSSYLRQAAERLDEYDVVFGPSSDGGVVLMGARCAWPKLRNLPWSTEHLYDSLSAVCNQSGCTTTSLEMRSDIDTASDLLAAQHEFAEDIRLTRRNLSKWISEQTERLTIK